MAIGDVDGTAINKLLGELKTLAVKFLRAKDGEKQAYYTMSASVALSEADARAMVAAAGGDVYKGTADGKALRLVPKQPQRKKDGVRGAQMNFWLHVDNQYHQKYNIHVDVLTLEKAFEHSIKAEQAKAEWKMTAKDITKKAAEEASNLRGAKGWQDLASK
ncbi:hypothetical protein BurJ1DRAFT_1654 [Burkholderiales bacterium JOSHI_001]|nr:hypothetical protein BurJ1DRAFT_1654 [Burkholderiales bacterium JOSHI_001]